MSNPSFAPVGHPNFRRLSFADQVRIVSLYTYHQDEYVLACKEGGWSQLARKLDKELDRELRKIEEGLAILDTLRADGPPSPDPKYDLQVMRVWAAYRCNYQKKPWLEVDKFALNVTHHYVVNVRLFNLPVLAVSHRANIILTWLLLTMPRAPSAGLLRTLAVMVGLTKDWPDWELEPPSTSSKHPSGKFCQSEAAWRDRMQAETIRAMNILQVDPSLPALWSMGYHILDDAETHGACVVHPHPAFRYYNGYRVSQRLALLHQMRTFNRRVYLPLVPEFWFLRARNFHIQDWALL